MNLFDALIPIANQTLRKTFGHQIRYLYSISNISVEISAFYSTREEVLQTDLGEDIIIRTPYFEIEKKELKKKITEGDHITFKGKKYRVINFLEEEQFFIKVIVANE